MLKYGTILFLAFFLSACISRSERNSSLINGVWLIEKPDEKDSHNLSLIYFSNGKIALLSTDIYSRLYRFKDYYKCKSDHLIINSKSKSEIIPRYEFRILDLNVDKMSLLRLDAQGNTTNDTFIYKRQKNGNLNWVKRISVAYNGLQAWDVEVNENLICKAAFNRKIPKEVIEWKFPQWKWMAIERICPSNALRSFVDRSQLPGMACGGNFAMIIELKNGKKYHFLQANDPFVKIILQIVWGEAMQRDLDFSPRKKGTIYLHKELMELYGDPPVEQKTLQFVHSVK